MFLAWHQVLTAWNCDFAVHQSPCGIETIHISMLWSPLVWTGWYYYLFFFFFFPQACSLQVGMVVSWWSQESRGLVIRVVVTDYKFFLGEDDTNMPSKLSMGKAQMVPIVWKGVWSSRLSNGYCSLLSCLQEVERGTVAMTSQLCDITKEIGSNVLVNTLCLLGV